MAAKLRVTLVKSPISHTGRTRGTLRALGLRRLGGSVELPDNPQTRGMIRAVNFLVEAEELDQSAAQETPAPRSRKAVDSEQEEESTTA